MRGRETDGKEKKRGAGGKELQVEFALSFPGPHLVCKLSASVINYGTTLVGKRGRVCEGVCAF